MSKEHGRKLISFVSQKGGVGKSTLARLFAVGAAHRGHADAVTQELAEDSQVVFLPTGTSMDDMRPTLALARKLAKQGAEGRIVIVLSKVGRSEKQISKAI